MTKEQELIDQTALSLAKILQHDSLASHWEAILDETRGCMREWQAIEDDRGRNAESIYLQQEPRGINM